MEEEKNINLEPTDEEFDVKDTYVPRPKWQIAAAWLGLAVFIGVLVMYYGLLFQ